MFIQFLFPNAVEDPIYVYTPCVANKQPSPQPGLPMDNLKASSQNLQHPSPGRRYDAEKWRNQWWRSQPFLKSIHSSLWRLNTCLRSFYHYGFYLKGIVNPKIKKRSLSISSLLSRWSVNCAHLICHIVFEVYLSNNQNFSWLIVHVFSVT